MTAHEVLTDPLSDEQIDRMLSYGGPETTREWVRLCLQAKEANRLRSSPAAGMKQRFDDWWTMQDAEGLSVSTKYAAWNGWRAACLSLPVPPPSSSPAAGRKETIEGCEKGVKVGYYVEFARGSWAKKGDEKSERFPGPAVYYGSVSKEQSIELELIVRTFLDAVSLPLPPPPPSSLHDLNRDDALERIARNVREIEILCDHYGLDPTEWLASGVEPGMVMVPEKVLRYAREFVSEPAVKRQDINYTLERIGLSHLADALDEAVEMARFILSLAASQGAQKEEQNAALQVPVSASLGTDAEVDNRDRPDHESNLSATGAAVYPVGAAPLELATAQAMNSTEGSVAAEPSGPAAAAPVDSRSRLRRIAAQKGEPQPEWGPNDAKSGPPSAAPAAPASEE